MKRNLLIRHLRVLGLVFFFANTALFAENDLFQSKPLSKVLDQISEKYQVIITYNSKAIANTTINFEFKENEKLESAVNRALINTTFSYKQLTEKYYVVFNKKSTSKHSLKKLKRKFKEIEELERKEGLEVKKMSGNLISNLETISNTVQQKIKKTTITGTIFDESDEPLIGVSVLEKGTTNGTVTGLDGSFTLNVTDDNAILVISYIGYESQEIAVAGNTTFNINLEVEVSSLESIVVVGYGTQKKKDLTGSVVSIKEEDFTQGANYSALQLLNGAASGVNVSQVSSAPGAGLKVQVRGAGSINSDNSVLFVVDGLPGVDPSALSPGDIESIDVLKDASSAAIYGTRAANGVVLITTKKGRKGTSSIGYNAYFGTQSIATELDVLGAQDYANLVNSRTPGTYTSEQIAGFGAGTNWQDEIFRNAMVQNHQLSMSGGGDNGNYYLGLNYFDQDGIVDRSNSQKYNIRLNVQSRPLDNLQITASANYTRQNNDEILFSNSANEGAGPINSAIQFDPTLSAELDSDGRYFRNPSIALDNPLALINGIDNQRVLNRFYTSVTADYEFIDNLTATVRVGAESNNSRFDSYNSRSTLIGLANGGIGNINSEDDTHWLVETLLQYKNTFNLNHNFSVLGGITFEEFLFTGLTAGSASFLSDATGTNLLQSGNGDLNDNVGSYRFKNQLNGFIGRTTYDFKNKYLMTASFRVDGSSRFSDNNKYAFFPSGSIGWKISEEDFLKGSKTISDLKLRIGYGELGNQGINNFETRQTLVSRGSNAVFGGGIAQGVVAARLPNPDLRWETTRELNIGIDYALADYKITGSIDFFNRNTSDQLFEKPLPSVVGFGSVRTNLGSVRNRGVDFNLRTVNVAKGNFKWESNLTLSLLKNEVTELPDFTEEIISGSIGTFINQFTIVREGAPLQSYYGYEIDGIFQEGDDIANSPTPDVAGYAPGMPRFVDQNGDGLIDADDRVVLGDPFPDMTFGFNNLFRYKNISLEIFIQGVQGIETLDGNVFESIYPTNDSRNSISKYYNERWTPSNPSNTLPSGENPSLYGGATAINSLSIVDASFTRIKNITLGYNFPLKNGSRVSSLNLFVAADNIYTITDFEGYDPDASSVGSFGNGEGGPDVSTVTRAAYNSYPLARTFRFGVDVKF